MSYLRERIESYLPLTSMEQAFRYIYENKMELSKTNPDAPEFRAFFAPLSNPRNRHEHQLFSNMVHSMRANEAIPDNIFFSPGQNFSVNRHPRYMPEIAHSHDGFFEIQCVLNGQFTQNIGEVSVTLKEGDICFVASNTIHNPIVMDDETLIVNILVRTGTLRTALSEALLEDDVISQFLSRVLYGKTYQPILVCSTDLDERVFRLILDMVEDVANPAYQTFQVDKTFSIMLCLLFSYLLRDFKEHFKAGKNLRKNDDNIFHILRYINSHFEDISLSSLAEHFNYTPSYLSVLIRKNFGKSFQNLVTELRLNEAARMIKTTDTAIADIIADVGYTEKSYFYKIFKEKFGMTPNEYRKMSQ